MLKVPQQYYIHFLREVDGCSIQEIAERVDVNWRTAKKYADREDWNQQKSPRSRRYPVLGPYIEIVDTWLIEDERLPRKQRQTGTRIYKRLKKEHSYTGSIRTVLDYIKRRKEQLAIERAKSYERLEHPGGEAQADFGTYQVAMKGEFVERKVLTLSFPFSNAAFAFPVPSENTECFLEALKHCFEQAGGIPRRIWFDNLSAAVVSVGKEGQRELTEAFMNFSAHYRFESVFCNPASGNEKGNVENKVGYGRRNWCSPPPIVENDEAFERLLADCAKEDMERVHYSKQETIVSLWEQEKALLQTMPSTAYDVYRLESRKLNKYAELQFEDKFYPLPQCNAEQTVLLRIRFKDMDVLDGTGNLLAVFPRPYTQKKISPDWKAIVDEWIKRPRAVAYSAFASMLPDVLKQFLQKCDVAVCKTRLKLMKQLLRDYGLEEISEALSALSQSNNVEIALENKLYALRHPVVQIESFTETYTPASVNGHNTDLSTYDKVLPVSMI